MKPRLIPATAAAALTIMLLSACGSMTGLTGSSSSFACKAPDGVSCTSVSGVYANAQQNNLPALRSRAQDTPAPGALPTGGAAFPLPAPGMPIRSQARMLRIWVAPWRDDEDTLHDQSYLYVMLDPGKWLIEHSREATVRKTMTRLQPLGRARAVDAPAEPEPARPGAPPARVRDNADAQAAAREAAAAPSDGGEPQ
jgi:conjugal transfer pilus assembly protein TraV